MKYSENKATAVACFFLRKAGGEMEDLKLMKLMYLAEREAIRVRNAGITGDQFISMKNGPVLSATLDRISPQDQLYSEGFWREHISVPSQWKVRLERDLNESLELSRREIAILDRVWEEHGSKTKWQLVDLVHSFQEWQNPGNSRIPIAFQDILQALGFGSEERHARMAEYSALQEKLAS